jgi:hypothetical protein
MVHSYQDKDIHACLGDQRVVFVGNSTIRQIFWATVRQTDPDGVPKREDSDQEPKDIAIRSGNVTFQFVWDPWMDSTILSHELLLLEQHVNSTQRQGSLPQDSSAGSAASLVVVTPGLSYARYGLGDSMGNFARAIEPVIMHPSISSMSNFEPCRPSSRNRLILAPI